VAALASFAFGVAVEPAAVAHTSIALGGVSLLLLGIAGVSLAGVCGGGAWPACMPPPAARPSQTGHAASQHPAWGRHQGCASRTALIRSGVAPCPGSRCHRRAPAHCARPHQGSQRRCTAWHDPSRRGRRRRPGPPPAAPGGRRGVSSPAAHAQQGGGGACARVAGRSAGGGQRRVWRPHPGTPRLPAI